MAWGWDKIRNRDRNSRSGRLRMSLFSQRKGITPIRTVIQADSIDDELRSRLWNALDGFYWHRVEPNPIGGYRLSCNESIDTLFKRLWHNYFKEPLDTLNDDWPSTRKTMRDYFFTCEWYQVYDLIEFIASNYPDEHARLNIEFMKFCNTILEQELSAYRFVEGRIVQITSEQEITEIEEAFESPVRSSREHLERSLDLLADRENPDYRNSIKEAICAVEAMCRVIVGNDKATVGQALKEIESRLGLHPALRSALDKLYGYTSDASGIRHALTDGPNVEFEDAKFMLVSCSAFINYLVAKSSRAGLTWVS
jgi:hypothetical protein